MSNPNAEDASLESDYFSTLSPDWIPDATPSDGRPYTVITVSKTYGDARFGQIRGVRVDQGTGNWLKCVLYSQQTGAPVKVSVNPYSDAPTVVVRYREASGYDPRIFIPDEGDLPALSTDGTYVALPLPIELKNSPGVYQAQVQVRDTGGVERNRTDFTVVVDRGLFLADGTAPSCDRGPVTIGEIRTGLRDHPAANRLLGDYEFDVAELASGVVSAVTAFNTTLPAGVGAFSTVSWPGPWRRQMMDGCLAYLFETAASYHRRGHLPYSAAGLSVDDLAKEVDYLKASAMYRDRYLSWCRQTRVNASIQAGWGSLTGHPGVLSSWTG